MSYGYRLLILGAFGLAVFTALGTGAFYGSLYSPDKRHYQSVGPNSGQSYPNDSPRNGLADVSGIDSVVESAIAKPQPRNTDEREQRDLAAQESMAVFAYWMFGAMMLQTALAGGALVALVKDLRQNRRSAELQLRAYVSATPSQLESYEVGTHPVVHLDFRNGGSSPAYGVYHYGDVAVLSLPLETDPTINRTPPNQTPAPFSLFSTDTRMGKIAASKKITSEQIEAIQQGEKGLFAYGDVIYYDTFGVRRETEFCAYLSGQNFHDARVRSRNNPGENIPIQWMIAPFHNRST